MWKHFFEQNEKVLCCNKENIQKKINCLTTEDLKNLKSLPSVKTHLEGSKETGTTDNGFKVIVLTIIGFLKIKIRILAYN